MAEAEEIIRASEIGLYVYCARAWWLGRVLGYASTNVVSIRRGVARHRAHGRAVQAFHRLRWMAAGLLLLAGLLSVVWLLLSLGR